VNRYDGSEFVRTIETRVTLPVRLGTIGCAATPAAPSTGLSLVAVNAPRGTSVRWDKVTDDTGDPTRLLRYVIRRRPSGGTWRTVAVVEATGTGNGTAANKYAWTHASLESGSFEYS